MSNAKVFTSLFDIRYSVFDIKILNLMTLAGIHFYRWRELAETGATCAYDT